LGISTGLAPGLGGRSRRRTGGTEPNFAARVDQRKAHQGEQARGGSAGIAAAVVGSGVHAVMGIGGAPEGVLTAAAMRCLNGEIFARLVIAKPGDEERAHAMGIKDLNRIYRSNDLAPGQSLIFAATGVTEGSLMKGVRFFGDGTRTTSLVMQTNPHRIRFIDSIHVSDSTSIGAKIRF
jgi:fructose-1,6-bisphosphatase II